MLGAFAAFASLAPLAGTPAVAGDSSKATDGAHRGARVTVDGDTPLGSRGPQGPNGPLVSVHNGVESASTGVRIGSGEAPVTVKGAFGEIGKSTSSFTRQPSFLQKPLETTVTAIKNNTVTIETPQGKGTIKVPPGRLAVAGIEVGTKVTVTADNGGATVQVRAANSARAAYAGIYVGLLQSSGETYLRLRLRSGAMQTFSANRDVAHIARALNGKTIALQSSDGHSVRTLLTSQQFSSLLNSVPKPYNHYIGKIVNTTKTSVTLDLRNGSVQNLQCSNCAGRKFGSVSLVRGLTVYAVSNRDARLVDVASVPAGTRIVGQLTSANADVVSVMLASGDIATLPCQCANLFAGLGNLAPGEPIIADLDQNASVASLLRYPDDGRIAGKLVEMKANRLSLQLPNGRVKSFACHCLAGLIAKEVQPPVGKTVIATLNPQAEVVSITASPQPRCRARKGLDCNDGVPKTKVVRQLPAVMPSLNVAAAACPNSDSAGIFIMLRHWRSHTPVNGASVKLSGPASITLASPPSGYIELLNVPSGGYHLNVQKTGLRGLETSEFRVNCNEAMRVQADLQSTPRMVRVVRIQKRRLVFRVVTKEKAPLHCFYGATPNNITRTLQKTFVLKTAKSYYLCGIKKVPVWKAPQTNAVTVRRK